MLVERLYYQDSYLRSFKATVLGRRSVDGHSAVILDKTAFYPTSGGQPCDTGKLNNISVIDVQALEDGSIVHVLACPLIGSDVCGEIDWARRFDHMQQHSGQHILSQAFLQTAHAETVSFHLGADESTIDLDRAPLSQKQVVSAVQLANQIGFDDRPLVARFVDGKELASLPLRKMPTMEGPIRIVHVADFDWSPCGGTHVKSSGEIGLIQVTRIERRKEHTRIYFVCGWRALADYTKKQDIVQILSSHFTTAADNILSSVQRIESEAKNAHKSLAAAQQQLVEYQLENWIDQAEHTGQLRIVKQVFQEYDLDLVKEIARRLTASPGLVALLAATQQRTQLVFACADDVPAHMGDLMRIACAYTGGRGGGSPKFAQGSIPNNGMKEAPPRGLVAAEQALSTARQHLLESLEL